MSQEGMSAVTVPLPRPVTQFLEVLYESGNRGLIAIRRIDAVDPHDDGGCALRLDGDIQSIRINNGYADLRDILKELPA